MARRIATKHWMMGAGAGALLLVGGLAAGPVAGLAQGDPSADLSKDEAAQIAIAEYPGTTATSVDLEEEDGNAIYDVNLSNGYEVEVDGNSGQILETEASDDDHEGDDSHEADDANDDDANGAGDEVRVPAGSIDDGADLLPQATI
ncbi:MAG TPA: PepSY domain-containing protein, partial [Thermomicrobiales bacterium]|nr:PepSY domain-containing protein [Thermomicrobiales bacterium]